MKAKDTFFQSWTKNMVLYGLDASLGQFFMNAPETSCLYQLGNFIFPSGQVDPNLWQEFSKKYSLADKVIISEEPSWQEFLDDQSELGKFTRYAFADRADFSGFDHFQAAGGFGFLLYSGEDIIAGVSTGLVYHGAFEIEIATKPAYQRQGLAKILGAQMILEAQKHSLFPLWDAHNEASKKVAESLGYQCLGAYPAYEWKGTFNQ